MIENKMYQKVSGRIKPETINLVKIEKDYKLQIEFVSVTGEIKTYELVKQTLTKFAQLYKFSFWKLMDDMEKKAASLEETEKWIRTQVADKDRVTVALLNEGGSLRNLVSELHQQMPLGELAERIKKKAEEKGYKTVKFAEKKGSYEFEFDVGSSNGIGYRVHAYLGRNDAMGSASIRFIGGGNIAMCSNQIFPYLHRSVSIQLSPQAVSARPNNIIHVQGVNEKVLEQIHLCFLDSEKQAKWLSTKLEESQQIPMERKVQMHALSLLDQKFNLGEKWLNKVTTRLSQEEETLFGLSQALTFVGTHESENKVTIQEKLCKLGGQVVLIGKEVVEILKESLKNKAEKIKEIQLPIENR